MKNTLSIFIAIIIFTSCKKDNNNTPAAATTIPVAVDNNLGTFIGDLLVREDGPPNNSGYIYNAKVTVISNGSVATFKVVGDGFNREYKSKNDLTSNGTYIFYMDKQTKPVEKIATGNCAITSNTLTFNAEMSSDTITVKDDKGKSLVLSGRIIISKNLIKQ
jgi:hypothetical protein